MIRVILLTMLLGLMVACSGYQPPSGQGYDYDFGRAVARNDIRAGRFVYYVSGDMAEQLVVLRERIEANCGFIISQAYDVSEPEQRKVRFVQGYNSVSVPAIEKRLGVTVSKAIEHCVRFHSAPE